MWKKVKKYETGEEMEHLPAQTIDDDNDTEAETENYNDNESANDENDN